MLNHKTANKSTAPFKKLGPEKNKQSSGGVREKRLKNTQRR